MSSKKNEEKGAGKDKPAPKGKTIVHETASATPVKKAAADKPKRVRTKSPAKPIASAKPGTTDSKAEEPTKILQTSTASVSDEKSLIPKDEPEASLIPDATEEDEITASIIDSVVNNPAPEKAQLVQPLVQSSPANTVTEKKAVSSSAPKETVVYAAGSAAESPQMKEAEGALRKQMKTIINFLEQWKKDKNCYNETVQDFLKNNEAPGYTFTYDASTSTLTGNRFGQVEIKMPFEVSAHPTA